MRIARKRFARRQWARRWLALRGLLVVVLLAAVAAGLGWLVFFSSVLSVDGVEVEGVDVLDASEVRRVAAVPLGEPLARVPVGAIEARVQSLAPVKVVDVSRSWPDRVRIAVVEREAVAVVERGGVLHGVDEEGVLFRSYASRPAALPVVRISAGTRSEALAEAAQVIAALPGDLAGRVDHLAVETVDSISLRLANGKTVFWGSAHDSATKAEVLAVLLRQNASVYDVSVPSQPTIKR
ncbi:MAG TPA: FtsQ-type POTRA domain-containing protein [Acidimicrobiales bacterium]